MSPETTMGASDRSRNVRPRFTALFAATLLAFLAALGGCGDTGVPSAPSALIDNARQSGQPTLVEFGASSCKSCREMKATLDAVARARQGKAHVIVVDLSKEWDLATAFRIQLMPTQVFFDARGNESQRHMGAMERDDILAVLDKLGEGQP